MFTALRSSQIHCFETYDIPGVECSSCKTNDNRDAERSSRLSNQSVFSHLESGYPHPYHMFTLTSLCSAQPRFDRQLHRKEGIF